MLFEKIQDKIQAWYNIRYRSPQENCTPPLRQITLSISTPHHNATDSDSYLLSENCSQQIHIDLTEETKLLLRNAVSPSNDLSITAHIYCGTGSDCQPNALLSCKTRTIPSTESDILPYDTGNGLYSFRVPQELLSPPGLEFFIKAYDSSRVVVSPRNYQENPWMISVLENTPSVILHDTVDHAVMGSPVRIVANVTDSTNSIDKVNLYFKSVMDVAYTKRVMVSEKRGDYSCYISENLLESDDIAYFIEAIDDYGVSTYNGSIEEPHIISIDNPETYIVANNGDQPLSEIIDSINNHNYSKKYTLRYVMYKINTSGNNHFNIQFRIKPQDADHHKILLAHGPIDIDKAVSICGLNEYGGIVTAPIEIIQTDFSCSSVNLQPNTNQTILWDHLVFHKKVQQNGLTHQIIAVNQPVNCVFQNVIFQIDGSSGSNNSETYAINTFPPSQGGMMDFQYCKFRQTGFSSGAKGSGALLSGARALFSHCEFNDLHKGVYIAGSNGNIIASTCEFSWDWKRIPVNDNYVGVSIHNSTYNRVGEGPGGVYFNAYDRIVDGGYVVGIEVDSSSHQNAFLGNTSSGLRNIIEIEGNGNQGRKPPSIEASNGYQFEGLAQGAGFVELFMGTHENPYRKIGEDKPDENGRWFISAEYAHCEATYVATATDSNSNTSEVSSVFTPVACRVIHVEKWGDDSSGDGTEEKPFKTISRGIQGAMNGEIVLVGYGIYDETIFLNKDILLTTKDQYDPSFSRDQMSVVIDGSTKENCVLTCSGVTPHCEVRGFIIKNGKGVGNNGGGITLRNASPTLKKLEICYNEAYWGGGIYVDEHSILTIDKSKIHHNEANDRYGGGFYIRSNSRHTITNCLIYRNQAFSRGGGIYCATANTVTGASLNINHTTITTNKVYISYYEEDPSGTPSQRATNNNRLGGGVGLYGINTSVNIQNSIIHGNRGGSEITFDNEGTTNTLALTYCCLSRNYPFSGEGCFVDDPNFKDPLHDDYTLYCSSPCLNKGNPEDNLHSDINDDPRPRPSFSRSDLGAIESVFAMPPTIHIFLEACYCSYSDPVILRAEPEGGRFYGEGVENGIFYPDRVTSNGDVGIFYEYTIANNCVLTEVEHTFVHKSHVTFTSSDADCIAQAEGSITATISPTEGNYDYYWTGENLPDTLHALTLTAHDGTYSFHYKNLDCDGCGYHTLEKEITNPFLSVEITGNNTCGESVANVTVNARTTSSDGTPYASTYKFTWSKYENGAETIISESTSSGSSTLPLVEGNYAIAVVDMDTECSRKLDFEVLNSPPISLTLSSEDCRCYGSMDGEVCAISSGGIMPHLFHWEDALGNEVGSSACCSQLAAGNYTVTVSGGGCVAQRSILVSEPGPLGFSAPVQVAHCSAQAYPGEGEEPYTFTWQKKKNNAIHFEDYRETNAPLITGLGQGSYRVRYTDANHCPSSDWMMFTVADTMLHSYDFAFRFTGEYAIEPVNVMPKQRFNVPQLQDNLYAQLEECVQRQEVLGAHHIDTDCLNAELEDELEVSLSASYYHFTLYYYDRAGNLVQTVPPQGVDEGNNLSSHPSHELQSQYKYNAMGQLVTQSTPDGGTTNFWYNSMGQLRLSQNEKQLTSLHYAYTKYDNLGRVIETGITRNISNISSQLDDPDFPDATSNSEQVYTVYSTPSNITYYGEPQSFIHNRVSYSYNHEGVKTVYSYDPHGNVEWIVQHLPGLGDNYLRYTYDLISGKVTEVAYNEYHQDRFFHRYHYDEDNRLIQCETSRDHLIWEKDAGYDYFAHGPLKRIEIGEDRIQGMDYTYTLQGWLKAINNAIESPEEDPGQDGNDTSPFPKDGFGMSLGYYENDFENSYYPNFISANSFQEKHLYNGNIASWSFRNSKVENQGQVYKDTTLGFQYTYDFLNRIKEASLNIKAATSWEEVQDYHSDYSYDKNGNLQELNRKTRMRTAIAIDNLSYTYQQGSNQLSRVIDHCSNSADGTCHDITGRISYTYDKIGNLITESSVDYRLEISWTSYGKVDKIVRSASDAVTVIDFMYDAHGNRVRKDVYDQNSYPEGMQSTFYVRDASGNIMGLYARTIEKANNTWIASWNLIERPIYGTQRIGLDKTVHTIGQREYQDYASGQDTLYPDKQRVNTYHHLEEAFQYGGYEWVVPTLDKISSPSVCHLERKSFNATNPPELGHSSEYLIDQNLSMYMTEEDTLYVAFANTSGHSYVGSGTGIVPLPSLDMDETAQSLLIRVPGDSDKLYLVYRNTLGELYAREFDRKTLAPGKDLLLDDSRGIGYSFAGIEIAQQDSFAVIYYSKYENKNTGLPHGSNHLCAIKIKPGGEVGDPHIVHTFNGTDSRAVGEIQVSTDTRYIAWMVDKTTSMTLSERTLVVHELKNDYISSIPYEEIIVDNLNLEPHTCFDFSPCGDYLILSAKDEILPAKSGLYYYSFPLMELKKFNNTLTGAIRRTPNGNIGIAKADSLGLAFLPEGDPYHEIVSETNTSGYVLSGQLPTQVIRKTVTLPEPMIAFRKVKDKQYELTDHLGSVRTVVKDVKYAALSPQGSVTGPYRLSVDQVNDYYPFGSLLCGRSASASDASYR
ncbi:MAG: hypothetical protein CSA04_03630, partial [Bacteroidetes bacterium]